MHTDRAIPSFSCPSSEMPTKNHDVPVFRSVALNERDYGKLIGMNKDEARKTWGDEQVHL